MKGSGTCSLVFVMHFNRGSLQLIGGKLNPLDTFQVTSVLFFLPKESDRPCSLVLSFSILITTLNCANVGLL